MSDRRFLVIWNGRAGGRDQGDDRGDGDDPRLAQVRDGLRRRGVQAEIFASPSEDSTRKRIADALAAAAPFDAIVAAGGDHTVRSVAFELIGTKQPLGILPLGTAMNIARSLDLPLELDAALDVLATGRAHAIDVGYIGEQPFLEVATIGLAAELLDDATAASEGRVRPAIDLVRRFIRHRRTRAWLDLDGRQVRHRIVSIAIANGPFTGRALEAAPDAAIDDGLLDVACYVGLGPLDALKELVRVALGMGPGSRTVRYRAPVVGIRTHRPVPVRADSHDIGTTPITATMRAGALRILTR